MNNYLIIENNLVTNICVWDGDVNSWQPPSEAITLIAETTPTKIWNLDLELKDYVLVDSIGNASIGFTYDGSVCITNEEKPIYVEPKIPKTVLE